MNNIIDFPVNKVGLVSGLYRVLKEVLLEVHGDEMDEDIRDYELYTNNENTVYMSMPNSTYAQDVAIDDRAVALVDAINVLLFGKVMKCKEM